MGEPDTSANHDRTLRMLNAKAHDKGQQDQVASRTNDGCTRKQLIPCDAKEKMPCETPTGLMQWLHTVGILEVSYTPRHLGGSRSTGVQLSQDLIDVHQFYGRPQLRKSSMRSHLDADIVATRVTSGRIIQTGRGVELMHLDNGARYLVRASGTILTSD
ncbi:hypothetical protein MTO96_008950 [Rhipicephalus appendiculatus]